MGLVFIHKDIQILIEHLDCRGINVDLDPILGEHLLEISSKINQLEDVKQKLDKIGEVLL